jgi:hypothetical protein
MKHSLVIRSSNFRLPIALAAELDSDMDHVHIRTAFLNSKLEKDMCLEQPGWVLRQLAARTICLLKTATCGLKQASWSWNTRLDKVLTSVGLKNLPMILVFILSVTEMEL